MQIVKALIGGLVGGGIGAFIAHSLSSKEELGSSVGWFFILSGVLSGLAVRLICGADRSFLTGVIAAVTTVIAIMGATYASSVSERNSVAATMNSVEIPEIAPGDLEPPADEPESDSEEADKESDQENEPATDSATQQTSVPDREYPEARGSGSAMEAARNKKVPTVDNTTVDLLINGISALIAFVLGAGSVRATEGNRQDG